jgi:xanthine dehydrogenase molybdopterin-binding subunit B
MPKFKVRLESPDQMRDNGEPHFRVTSLVADSEEAARRAVERMEYRKATYELSADDLKAAEKAEKQAESEKRRPDAQTRMRLAIHRQEKPYEIVHVEAIG